MKSVTEGCAPLAQLLSALAISRRFSYGRYTFIVDRNGERQNSDGTSAACVSDRSLVKCEAK